jgi:hypothetical protein
MGLWDEARGERRKELSDELHDLHYSKKNIIRVMKSRRMGWAGHVARTGEERRAYRVLVGRPNGKISLGRPKRSWKDIIQMDIKKMGWGREMYQRC